MVLFFTISWEDGGDERSRQKREPLFRTIEEDLSELTRLRSYLYENPGIGGTEEKAHKVLTNSLENHGFTLTRNYYDFPVPLKLSILQTKVDPP